MTLNVLLPGKGNFWIEYVYIASLSILFDSAIHAWAAHMHRPHYVVRGCLCPGRANSAHLFQVAALMQMSAPTIKRIWIYIFLGPALHIQRLISVHPIPP